jgi:plastocyanin
MRRAVLAAGIVVAVAALAASPAAAAAGRTHEVAIKALAYVPQTLSVKPGDVVVWTNQDPFPHTVTAPGGFDSGSIAPGKSWRYKVKRAGTHPYVCTLHSNMKGTLQVE